MTSTFAAERHFFSDSMRGLRRCCLGGVDLGGVPMSVGMPPAAKVDVMNQKQSELRFNGEGASQIHLL